MSEAAFFGKEKVLELSLGQVHWQTRLVEEAIRCLKATMTGQALEHPDVGAQECLARAAAAEHALGRADLDGRFDTPDNEKESPRDKHIKNFTPITRCHGQPLESSGSQYLDISTDIPDDEEVPWTNHPLGRRDRHLWHKKHLRSGIHADESAQRHTVRSATAATACQQVPARRHHKKLSKTGAQVTQIHFEDAGTPGNQQGHVRV